MKPLVVHCEAQVELIAALQRYRCESPELARDFLKGYRAAQGAIQNQPDRFSFIDKPVRRVRISGFPYRVIYEELDDCIQVLAVMHDHRDPGYWKTRSS